MKISLSYGVKLCRLAEEEVFESEDWLEKSLLHLESVAELKEIIQQANNESGNHQRMSKISSLVKRIESLKGLKKRATSKESRDKLDEYHRKYMKEKRLLEIQRDAVNRDYVIILPERLVTDLKQLTIDLT